MVDGDGALSKAQVTADVKTFVGGFTGLKPANVNENWVLKDAPLSFDDNRLGFLAMSFRGYIKSHNKNATIKAAETRKSGQTVKGLAALVYERITT